MIGRPIQPPDEDREPAVDFDVAEALKRLADLGAEESYVPIPPTVTLRMVSKLRNASLIEVGGLVTPCVHMTAQGKRILPRALKAIAAGRTGSRGR